MSYGRDGCRRAAVLTEAAKLKKKGRRQLRVICIKLCRSRELPVFPNERKATYQELGMHRHRKFLFLFTFATVGTAVTPHALGQDISPAIGPASGGTQPAAFIPNLSGVWSHPYWPGFEPPASGPGPITNRSRLLVGPQRGVGNPIQLVGDYTNPILKPEAAGVVKQQGENELNGMGSATPLNQCWPGGVPFVLRDIGMQLLQQPDKIIMIYFQENGPPDTCA
jgi:hypothetical protein